VANPVGGPVTFKVRSAESGGALTVLETEVAASQGLPFHVHANEDETLYVLEGSFRFQLGDEVRDAPVGSFVYVPRGLPALLPDVGESAGRMLVTFSRPGWSGSSSGSPRSFPAPIPARHSRRREPRPA
jgi:quercetin dioxygenase-like cupin family protein